MLTVSVSPYISSSRCYDIDAKLLDIFIDKWKCTYFFIRKLYIELVFDYFFSLFFPGTLLIKYFVVVKYTCFLHVLMFH